MARKSIAWKETTFAALLAEPLRNGVYKPKEFHGRGVKIVNMGELFAFDYISRQAMKRLELDASELEKSRLGDGDLLFARRSVVLEGSGRCVLVVQPDEEMTFESSIIRARPNRAVADPRFLFYLFRSPAARASIAAISSQTAVSGIRSSDLANISLRVPPLEVQKSIANQAAVYDDLADNCVRRITRLEEMGRALHREWFVDFRFPGHSAVPFVDSAMGKIPQGWRVQRLGEVLELKYGRALKAEDRSGGSVPVFASSGVVGWHHEKLESGPGVIVGRKGNVGSVFWSDGDFFVIDTAYYLTSALPLRFWFFELPLKNFVNGDAAVPGLSRSQAYALQTLVPPAALLAHFAGIAESLMRRASILQRQADILRSMRDLLLERLLSSRPPKAEVA